MSDAGVWVKLEDAGSSGELPGLGGWAEITSLGNGTTDSQPKRYTDIMVDGVEFWAFEWADNGSVQTADGGLVDVLVVSAASTSTTRSDQGGHGGGVFRGVEVLEGSDPYLITVGKCAQYNSSGGPSIFNGMGPTGGLWNDYTWAGATGGVISMGLGGLSSYPGHGQMDDILGPDDIRGYGGGAYADSIYGGGNPPRANSGAGRTPGSNAPGADGVVIIRVPKDKVTATGGWV